MRGGASRWVVFAMVATAPGCFLDAVGAAEGNGGAGASNPTTGGMTSTSTTGGGGSGPAAGGGGGVAGNEPMGGSGGAPQGGAPQGGAPQGGAPPCNDSVLVFEGAQIAQVNDAGLDVGNDFVFGARARPDQDAKFVQGDGNGSSSVVLRRASFSNDSGYFVWFVERFDNGMAYAQVGIRNGSGSGCTVDSPNPTPWGQWTSIAGTFRAGPTNDLTLYVDGVAMGSKDCGNNPLPPLSAPFEVGATAEDPTSYFVGAVDDVFVRHVSMLPLPATNPITCEANMVAAFSFDQSLASLCDPPALTLTLGTNPTAADPADPLVQCVP